MSAPKRPKTGGMPSAQVWPAHATASYRDPTVGWPPGGVADPTPKRAQSTGSGESPRLPMKKLISPALSVGTGVTLGLESMVPSMRESLRAPMMRGIGVAQTVMGMSGMGYYGAGGHVGMAMGYGGFAQEGMARVAEAATKHPLATPLLGARADLVKGVFSGNPAYGFAAAANAVEAGHAMQPMAQAKTLPARAFNAAVQGAHGINPTMLMRTGAVGFIGYGLYKGHQAVKQSTHE